MISNLALLGTVLVLLAGATAAGQWLRGQESRAIDRRVVESFNARIQAWWFFCAVMALAFIYPGLTVLLFGIVSFWALREFVTLTPTRIGDHRALFWVFFFFTPAQFVLVYCSKWFETYGLYSVLIPVYAFLFIAARSAFAGDYERFLDRVAKVQCGLMICVFCISFAPALLYLKIDGSTVEETGPRMLFFFVTIVLSSDLLQWMWSRIYNRHIIAEKIDPTISWEGVLAGWTSTVVLGSIMWWAAPFYWWQTAALSLLIAVMATAGSLTVSAVKRDRGEVLGETFVEGHGILSRIDCICFAAPVFYHVTRYFFGTDS